VCGLVCLLLVLLWVRSYWRIDYVAVFRGGDAFGMDSVCGTVRPFFQNNGGWSDSSTYTNDRLGDMWDHYTPPAFSWNNRLPAYLAGSCPHWFLAVIAVIFAAAPWLKWRYRVGTLLIATTLVAVVLGLAVAFR
jgi:hypothetical protein